MPMWVDLSEHQASLTVYNAPGGKRLLLRSLTPQSQIPSNIVELGFERRGDVYECHHLRFSLQQIRKYFPKAVSREFTVQEIFLQPEELAASTAIEHSPAATGFRGSTDNARRQYRDGRTIPVEGDEVVDMRGGFGGSPVYLNGKVISRRGALRVEITSTTGFFGETAPVTTEPLSDGWTIKGEEHPYDRQLRQGHERDEQWRKEYEARDAEVQARAEASKAEGYPHLDMIDPPVGTRIEDISSGRIGTIIEYFELNDDQEPVVLFDDEPMGSSGVTIGNKPNRYRYRVIAAAPVEAVEEAVVPEQTATIAVAARPPWHVPKAQFIKHSKFLVEEDGRRILFDGISYDTDETSPKKAKEAVHARLVKNALYGRSPEPFPASLPTFEVMLDYPQWVYRLNQRAEKNVSRLLAQLGVAGKLLAGEDSYLKVENPPYTDLVIERLPGSRGDRLYLTHYLRMNGDSVLDAEMVFEIRTNGTLRLAETATQHPTRGGELRSRDVSFANMFSKNLLDQGFGTGKVLWPREERADALGERHDEEDQDLTTITFAVGQRVRFAHGLYEGSEGIVESVAPNGRIVVRGDGGTGFGVTPDEAIQWGLQVLEQLAKDIDPTSPEGYAFVMADEALQLMHQDTLDAFFAERMVTVRNALRDLGWQDDDAPAILKKNANGVTASATIDTRNVGAGNNVVAIVGKVYTLQSGEIQSFADDLTGTAAQWAEQLDKAAFKPELAPATEASQEELYAADLLDYWVRLGKEPNRDIATQRAREFFEAISAHNADELIEWLRPSLSPLSRTWFEKVTGVSLGRTWKETKIALRAWANEAPVTAPPLSQVANPGSDAADAEAREQAKFSPFDPSSVRMPTAIQLGLNNVFQVDSSDALLRLFPGGWSNGHILDLGRRPKVVLDAITKYYGDETNADLRKLDQARVDHVKDSAVAGAKVKVVPVARFADTYVRKGEFTGSGLDLKRGPDEHIPLDAVVLANVDAGVATAIDKRYFGYFASMYKGCEFIAPPDGAGAVLIKHNDQLVGIAMPLRIGDLHDVLKRAVSVQVQAVSQPSSTSDPAGLSAYEYGKRAFELGISAPALDAEFMHTLSDGPVGNNRDRLADWGRGWAEAHVASTPSAKELVAATADGKTPRTPPKVQVHGGRSTEITDAHQALIAIALKHYFDDRGAREYAMEAARGTLSEAQLKGTPELVAAAQRLRNACLASNAVADAFTEALNAELAAETGKLALPRWLRLVARDDCLDVHPSFRQDQHVVTVEPLPAGQFKARHRSAESRPVTLLTAVRWAACLLDDLLFGEQQSRSRIFTLKVYQQGFRQFLPEGQAVDSVALMNAVQPFMSSNASKSPLKMNARPFGASNTVRDFTLPGEVTLELSDNAVLRLSAAGHACEIMGTEPAPVFDADKPWIRERYEQDAPLSFVGALSTAVAWLKDKQAWEAKKTSYPDGGQQLDTLARQYASFLHDAMPTHHDGQVREMHQSFASAIMDKNVDYLIDWLARGRGQNKLSKKFFAQATGQKLPATIRDITTTLYAWAGFTPEQAAVREAEKQAAHEVEAQAQHLEYERRGVENSVSNARVNHDGIVKSAKQFIDDIIVQGYTDLRSYKSGAVTRYMLANQNTQRHYRLTGDMVAYAKIALSEPREPLQDQEPPATPGLD